jgi:hypothetical protein
MTTQLHHQIDVSVNRHGHVRRRDFLRTISAAGAAAGALSWADVMSLEAADLRSRGMACILLWMQGGPSQFETFSPKPGHSNGGETKAIDTSVSGIQIAENLPKTAQVMDDICIVRSMNSKEGSHPRATFLMHTGYLPSASVKYPTIGAHVAHQLGDPAFDLPSFVRVGPQRGGPGGGLLGVEFDPLTVADANRMPENTTLATNDARYRRRLQLLGRLESEFEANGGQQEVYDHRKLYDKASKLVLSPKMDTFNLQREPSSMRQAYGSSQFANGCLLARRLVEAGVTFVEVTAGNWDTHDNNFERSKQLCQQIDQPYAQLLADLKQRGMLDKTLVIWMGEFGRTPRVNARAGRDHYPRAFNVTLAGGGVKGGQVIGKTDAGGDSVTSRPVGVSDLFRTICHGLQINADHENMSSVGRPIKIVDGGQAVKEVFG